MNVRKTAVALVLLLILGVSGLWIGSCKKSNKAVSGRQTFYDSLGGTALVADPANFGQDVEKGYLTIRTIVDSALFIIAGDDSINGYFSILVNEDTLHLAPTEYQKLSVNMTNFFAVAAGAKDYSYTGPSLLAAHSPDSNTNIPMPVTADAFNRFAYDMGQSAALYGGLSAQLISQLGDLMYRYEPQVVQP